MKTLQTGYPLYDTVYGSEIPLEQYYVILFDLLPSKYVNNLSYDPSINEYLVECGFVKSNHVFSSNRRFDLVHNHCLFTKKNK